jgi:hypothetical protein
MKSRPNWYTDEHDSGWERVKSAFRRDWEQTKHDFGSDKARDLDQDVDDTVRQMAGSGASFEDRESAFRFGHAASRTYRSKHPKWNSELDTQLKNDYGADYERDRPFIQYAYGYRYDTTSGQGMATSDRPDAR